VVGQGRPVSQKLLLSRRCQRCTLLHMDADLTDFSLEHEGGCMIQMDLMFLGHSAPPGSISFPELLFASLGHPNSHFPSLPLILFCLMEHQSSPNHQVIICSGLPRGPSSCQHPFSTLEPIEAWPLVWPLVWPKTSGYCQGPA